MNLFVSIFGGMLLTAMVFGAVRSIKLSNFWAAVIAAALPSFAYMAYSALNWPGLDVLTMHVVAFPTVALLLYQIGGAKDAPYQKIHWAPKLLIGFFVLITVILGGFVYIAGNGVPPAVAQWLLPNIAGKTVHTGFAGVVSHGEEASKTIAHHRSMQTKLAKLGWNVEVTGLDTLRADQSGEISVMLSDNQSKPIEDVAVSLGLGRPGQPASSLRKLVSTGGGRYLTQVKLEGGGEWLAVLTLEQAGEHVVIEHEMGHR
jgi:hypothetical protein